MYSFRPFPIGRACFIYINSNVDKVFSGRDSIMHAKPHKVFYFTRTWVFPNLLEVFREAYPITKKLFASAGIKYSIAT